VSLGKALYEIASTYEWLDGHGPEPDSESKIWRPTGLGVLGSGFGVNFSDFAHLRQGHKRSEFAGLIYTLYLYC